jgi:putative peptidoglycan lipid II flippase
MIKFLSKSSQSITGAAFVISAASFVSMLVGLLRERVFAAEFGGGIIKDAYQTAFIVPDLLYNLLVIGALTAGFVPLFTRLYSSEKPERAWYLANNVLNICVGALIIICLSGIIFAHPLAHLIAFKSSPEKQELIGNFLRIILLTPIFLGISMIVGGVLQSLRQFLLYAIAPIFYNLGIIIGAVWLVKIMGINGLAWGVVFGAFLHMSVQMYGAIRNGFRWKLVIDFKDKESQELGRLMIPRTLGLAFTQMSLAVLTILGNTLPNDGNVSALGYATNLQGVPISLIGASFALAVFPVLASAAAQKKLEEFKSHLSTTLRQILFLIIPIATLFLILRIQIVRVIYGAGRFNWDNTVMTANVLACLSLGIIAESILPLLARAFYALSDTKTPFIMGAIAELTTITSAFLLMYPSFHALDFIGTSGIVAGLMIS